MKLPVYVYKERNVLELDWREDTLTDYFKGLKMLIELTKKTNCLDLHTYFYRKFLFEEYTLFKKAKNEFNIDITEAFSEILSSFDFKTIETIESNIPILKTIQDFENTNMELYKEFNY